MRIVCPNCDAAYEVPQTMLAPDRPVRCARCGRDWAPAAALPVAPSPIVPPPPASASPPAAPPPLPPPPPPPPASRLAKVTAVGDEPVLDLRRIRSLPVVPLPPAPGEAPSPPADPEPEPTSPVAASSAPPPVPRVRVPVLAGWILTAFVLLGSAWAAYVWRAEIVRAWPPSARVYTALGVAER